MSSGTARVTSPAPPRTAAFAARQGAPVYPRLPARINSFPKSPLWASAGRRGMHRSSRSISLVRHWSSGHSSWGMPMSATTTRPLYTAPLPTYSPGFPREKVTVTSARTAMPITPPVSAWIPLGTSADTTQPQVAIRRTAVAASGRSSLFSPTPNKASTATS